MKGGLGLWMRGGSIEVQSPLGLAAPVWSSSEGGLKPVPPELGKGFEDPLESSEGPSGG